MGLFVLKNSVISSSKLSCNSFLPESKGHRCRKTNQARLFAAPKRPLPTWPGWRSPQPQQPPAGAAAQPSPDPRALPKILPLPSSGCQGKIHPLSHTSRELPGRRAEPAVPNSAVFTSNPARSTCLSLQARAGGSAEQNRNSCGSGGRGRKGSAVPFSSSKLGAGLKSPSSSQLPRLRFEGRASWRSFVCPDPR